MMDASLLLFSSPAATPSTDASPRRPAAAHQAVGVWSSDEHDRFLDALKRYPHGPWKAITQVVGTRSVRQVQTHAQKYQEKVFRRLHGLKSGKTIRLRREHRIDHDTILTHRSSLCFSPKLRAKYARRTLIPPVPGFFAPCATIIDPPVRVDDKTPSPPLMGMSPSSVSTSSVLLDNAVFTLMDIDDLPPLTACDDENLLPTLSESLDFFIASFALQEQQDDDVDASVTP